MWIDSHCHVTADEFAADRHDVLDRAERAGVHAFIAIGAGWGIGPNERACDLAAADDESELTCGAPQRCAPQAPRKPMAWPRPGRSASVMSRP